MSGDSTWLNEHSEAVALRIIRDAISRNDTNATTEACAVVLVLLSQSMARDEGLDPNELQHSLLEHARQLVKTKHQFRQLSDALH